jgi:hypothetical protein
MIPRMAAARSAARWRRWRRGSLRRWRRGGGGALVLCSVGGSRVGEVAARRVVAACGGGCARTHGRGADARGAEESTNRFFSPLHTF